MIPNFKTTPSPSEKIVTDVAKKEKEIDYYNDHEKTLLWVSVCVVFLILATLAFVAVMCYLRYRRATKDRQDRNEVFQLFDGSPESGAGGVRLDRINRKQRDKPITAGNGYDVPYVDERNIHY